MEIPANTTAEIWLPASDNNHITEGGKPVKNLRDISLQRMEKNYAVFNVGSGEYHFESDYNK